MRTIERLLPPIAIDLIQRLRRAPGFYGDLPEFKESKYAVPKEKKRSFDILTSRDLQILSAFAPIQFESVLDVGSAHGDAFYLLQRVYRRPIKWTVLETPEVVAANKGKPFIEFVTETDRCFDVVHMSGVLQYLRDPYQALRKFSKQGRWLILNRLPLYSRDRITRQRTALGEHCAWFFDEIKIIDAIKSVGEIRMQWDVPEDCPLLDGKRQRYIGLLVHIDSPTNTIDTST